MKILAYPLKFILIAFLLCACSPLAQSTSSNLTAISPVPISIVTNTHGKPAASLTAASLGCTPTFVDELSPSYKPDAPLRSVVGHDHVLSGLVRSSLDCAPIPNAKLGLWPDVEGVGHPDEYRTTIFTDSAGFFRFECNPSDHIHMRISAPGYRTIASNAFHTEGRAEGSFDIVLVPETR